MQLRTVHAVVRRRTRRREARRWAWGSGVWLTLGTTQPVGWSLSLFSLALLLAVGGGVGGVCLTYQQIVRNLPAPEAVGQATAQQFKTTKIFDRTGQTVLYEIYDPYGGNRTTVPLAQIPLHLRLATLALEDKDFYTNPGFDVRGLTRAFVGNLLGQPVQGGSSITQQLVKNVVIEPELRAARSYDRKLRETVLAWELTRRYPGLEGKDQILEWYLNTVYYGHLAYGVQAAAETYFGKTVGELTLAEAAMLATFPRSPALNSLDNPDEARRQQAIALDEMVEDGYITREQAEEAKVAPLGQPKQRTERASLVAPHFAVWVRQLLEQRYGPERLYRDGLQVVTSLDLRLQSIAEATAREHIAKLQAQDKNVSNASLVALDPATGQVLAMLGSLDYWDETIDGQVNVALAPRQPGSAFKPITYVTAFGQGYTPATMILDVRTAFPQSGRPPYVPENYDRQYHGPVLLRTALANSYNIPAVKLLDMVGVQPVLDMAHRLGITGLNGQYGLALTLGGGEVSLLDLTYVYSVFANGGRMAGAPVLAERAGPGRRELDPVAILRVTDANGTVIDDFGQSETRDIVTPQQAFLITDILSDNQARVPAFTPDSPLKLSRPAAAKTGTTNDWRDNWTLGYTPELVGGVWVGNSRGQPMREVVGVDGAAPIWHDFMEQALEGHPPQPFVRPDGLEWAEVCALSGLKPTPLCPERRAEWFIAGTVPRQPDSVFQAFRVCALTGRLATATCPPGQVQEKVFPILPREAADWARGAGLPQPPGADDQMLVTAGGAVSLVSPPPQSFVHSVTPIWGQAGGPDFAGYRVEVGPGVAPTQWTRLAVGDRPVNGPLAQWDTRGLDGTFTVRLVVERTDGTMDSLRLPLTADNTPPSIRLVELPPVAGIETDEILNLQAEAEDNLSIERVDFLVDGRLRGSSTVAPYGIRWTLTPRDLGSHFVEAVAFDRAGNSAASQRARVQIVPRR
ncbi:MAG: transglycosylase domain-containing protein [Anaerolineae bacterium]|nr:transglycosylase domain-containing protein [Anaerolineae bacterium]